MSEGLNGGGSGDNVEPRSTEITHRCPLKGAGITPCCGRTPFELPRTDRITLDDDLVTCEAHSGSTVDHD